MTHNAERPGDRHRAMPVLSAATMLILCLPVCAQAQDTIVVTASRIAQQRFDAAASVDAVNLDALHANTPLVNLSEVMGAVPGLQLRERQNYAQDLQLSVRGFGTRSTFGVRGIRILIDGIPATMPDGQGQAATASLASTQRIEVLRGPVAQLYGNASGGVVQIFSKDPPLAEGMNRATASAGAGSDGQRQLGAGIVMGTSAGAGGIGALIDLTHYRTDGYRDHSAAERNQLNAKAVWKTGGTTLTGIVNGFHQPLAEDPLGLTRAQFEQNPRQAVAAAVLFNTRKRVEQQQLGLVMEHRFSQQDSLNARLYSGTRSVFQTLAFSGAAANSSGGVVDLDNRYQGASLSWSHRGSGTAPLGWTAGIEADKLDQERRGYVNDNGRPGALRRDETDSAGNVDVFGQLDWMFAPQWKATAGLRSSRVRLSVDDRYVTAASPDDSGSVEFRNTSPVAGLVWHARDDLNVYANIGKGFETPTITEIAYRAGGTGPNFGLRASRSLQAEAGIKWRGERQTLDLAVFRSRSEDEIVPFINDGGRSIFQNADKVTRQGIESTWKRDWTGFTTRMAYTFLDARFGSAYVSGSGPAAVVVAAGNRLPGAPRHSLFSQLELRPAEGLTVAADVRIESKAYVDDVNSDAAPGNAVFNLSAGKTFRLGAQEWHLFGRIDNVFDKSYAGSVIVNEGNRRFFEPAAGRRFFAGVRASL